MTGDEAIDRDRTKKILVHLTVASDNYYNLEEYFLSTYSTCNCDDWFCMVYYHHRSNMLDKYNNNLYGIFDLRYYTYILLFSFIIKYYYEYYNL